MFIQPSPNHPPGTKLIHLPATTKTENSSEAVKSEAVKSETESKPKGKADGNTHLFLGSPLQTSI